MIISDDKKISEVQQAFSEKFPFLKLEFYSQPHGRGEGSAAVLQLDPEKTIGEVRTIHTEGNLTLDGSWSVGFFERKCWNHFGLSAQVFRRSAKIWLQTSTTDDWTLDEQNLKGEHSTQQLNG